MFEVAEHRLMPRYAGDPQDEPDWALEYERYEADVLPSLNDAARQIAEAFLNDATDCDDGALRNVIEAELRRQHANNIADLLALGVSLGIWPTFDTWEDQQEREREERHG